MIDFRMQTTVTTAEVMGTVATIQVVYQDDVSVDTPEVAAAIGAFVGQMRADQAVFTTFEDSSVIMRLARGELTMAQVPPEVREVEQACRFAKVATHGRFDAWWRGWFDPTGYVKGWSTERAFFSHLAPLLESAGQRSCVSAAKPLAQDDEGGTQPLAQDDESASGTLPVILREARSDEDAESPQVIAVGVNVGGDMQLATRDDADFTWKIGVANPFGNKSVLAKFELKNGAVATSGPAERGRHIINPFTHQPVDNDVASATVVSDSLTYADVWATTAAVAGFQDLSWVATANTISGLLISNDGETRRWSGTTEIAETTPNTSPTALP